MPSPDQSHGGDRAAHRRRFPDAPEPLLDLSTGINPWPHPAGLAPPAPHLSTRLPPPHALVEVEALAKDAFALSPQADLAATPGSGVALALLAQLLRPASVAIVSPTYTGLAGAFRAAGSKILEPPTFEAAIATGAPALVLCRPNNPDGAIPEAQAILRAAATRTVIVDEAFADLEPCAADLAPNLGKHGPVLLRSFGKTYGLPGLRLGFAAGPPSLIARLRMALGAWPISGHAVAVAREALPDILWRARTADRTARSASDLDRILAAAGFTPAGGTSLFRLVRHKRAPEIADRLGQAGIMVRRFPHAPTLLRFGLPPGAASLTRLDAALAAKPLETGTIRE